MSNTSEFIKNFIDNKITTHTTEKNHFNEQILVLDNSRVDYKEALYKIDSNYFPFIQEVNGKIIDVKNAYDDRIDVGCRTDLFWRLIGVSTAPGLDPDTVANLLTYRCEQASPNGFGTSLLTYITPSGDVSTSDNLIGLESDNFYGIRIYDEPYSRDVIDSSVGSFIGTIGIGSTILTVMSPKITTEISKSLKVGQIIVDNDSNVFSLGLVNEIVGLGTTAVSLNLIDEDYPLDLVLVDEIILKYPAIRDVNAPESNGGFTAFTVLKDPDEIENYGLPFGSNPFSPQTIKMMTTETLGTGTQIEFDNASGYPNSSQSWNKFMEGFADPAYVGNYNPNNIVKKPKVGEGKIYYRVGFDYKPQINGIDAQLGDIAINSDIPLLYPNQATVVSLSPCPTQENALTTAITIRDEYENNLLNSNSEILQKIKLSNIIREELGEIDIRIWGYRCHMGKASENLDLYDQRLTELNTNDFADLIDS